MCFWNLRTLSASSGLLALSSVAQGQVVEGTLTGQITRLTGNIPGVAVGSPVVGTYRYDAGIEEDSRNPFVALNITVGDNPRPFTLEDLDQSVFTTGRLTFSSTPEEDILTLLFTNESLAAFTGVNGIFGQGVLTNPGAQNYFAVTGNTFFRFDFAASPLPSVPEPGAMSIVCGIASATILLRRRSMIQRKQEAREDVKSR
jgi:hypothetical protein